MSPLVEQGRSGNLPARIQQFIHTDAETAAYPQRSHPHQSLRNAHTIAVLLEEASRPAPVSALERNAGLRDLAQRLHVWPSDVAVELQRDALLAVRLLEDYVHEALDAELVFVERLEGKGGGGASGARWERLERIRDGVVVDLGLLAEDVRRAVRTTEEQGGGGWEVNDLALFIPGFGIRREDVEHVERERRFLGEDGEDGVEADSPDENSSRDVGSQSRRMARLVEQFEKKVEDACEEMKIAIWEANLGETDDAEGGVVTGSEEEFDAMEDAMFSGGICKCRE